MIEIQFYRMRIGLNYCRQAKVKDIDYLNYFEIYIMSALLILGIKRNPGPLLDESANSSSAGSTFEDKFSIAHYNSQSLFNKIDLSPN